MRDGRKNEFASNVFVSLKDQSWLDKQRVAGKVVAGALSLLEREVKNGTIKSLLELDALAETFIRDNGCVPTFLHFKGFPNSVCISVNRQLVHGIPTNYRLQDGDVVSFDLGATFEGAIGDSAITCIYGHPKSEQHVKLVAATELALMKGIEAIKVGNRLGCIGEAIYKSARSNNFSVVCNYGGHGIDWETPHASPFVANKGTANEGIRIQPGLTIAIEPMLVIGSSAVTTTGADGWTVSTLEIGAHWEHSVFVHEDNNVEIITDRTRS
jgi:methionyl aminopeptidase